MLLHLPKLIKLKNFREKYKYILGISFSQAIGAFAGSIQYAILPIVLMSLADEWVAGIVISAFTILQIFLLDPLGGAVADKWNCKKAVITSNASTILGTLIWIIFGASWLSMILGGFFLFLAYSLGSTSPYILRVSDKESGGLAFGIRDNIYGLSTFLATISIPFFIPQEYHIWMLWGVVLLKSISLITTYFLPEDIIEDKDEEKTIVQLLNPYETVKHGLHFTKINGGYPILALGSSLFEGLFYGTIWFIFPLYFASQNFDSIIDGLQLGIYEVVTMLIAGYAGYLADKYNWKHLHALGWLFIFCGVIAMPLYSASTGLIIAGLIIGIGNNLSYSASEHILEAKDIDHKEDGAFNALRNMVTNIGYAVAPLVAGFMYTEYGFATSLWYITTVCGTLAIWLTWKTYQLEE